MSQSRLTRKSVTASTAGVLVAIIVATNSIAAEKSEKQRAVDYQQSMNWGDLTTVQKVKGPDGVTRTLKIGRKLITNTVSGSGKRESFALLVKNVPAAAKIINYQAALVSIDSDSPDKDPKRGRYQDISVGLTTHKEPERPQTIVVLADATKHVSSNHPVYIDISVWCEE